MTTLELYNLTADALAKKIQTSIGLTRFAYRRAKFEGWLKVEIIDILARKGYDALPEIDRIDVSFDNVAIELKTVNTNFRCQDVINLKKPITKNINGVVKDIESLRNKNYLFKFVVFIVFPIIHEDNNWQIHLNRIKGNLKDHLHKKFYFNNNIQGVIYYGQV